MQNCAREPRSRDLAALLNAMGAKIHGAGNVHDSHTKGVDKLHGARHRIIPDRIEAGTFIIAAALTGGDLNVADAIPRNLTAILQKLAEKRREDGREGRFRTRDGRSPLAAADMNTEEYPGFPTDMQAQYMALATQAAAHRSSRRIFSRTGFMDTRRNWSAMGANIKIEGRRAMVRGGTPLSAAAVLARTCAPPPRWCWAALVADGENHHRPCLSLDRGYETSKRS